MTFLNDSEVETEGELIFPMPEGAALCGYAVDINGQLVDGVLIEVANSILSNLWFCRKKKQELPSKKKQEKQLRNHLSP